MPDPPPSHERSTLSTGATLDVIGGPAGDAPLMLVLPGGAYQTTAPHEGLPVARWLTGLGMASAVLNYRHAPEVHHPEPLRDVEAALKRLREQDRRVGILGFSAGGHLAATTITQGEFPRPEIAVLCYPVITLLPPYYHAGSRANLLGDADDDRQAEALSAHLRVDLETPPTFLWHSVDDEAVPVENSLMFAEALRAHRRPFALHITGRDTPHGVGMAEEDPLARTWMHHCAAWLAAWGFGKEEE